MINENRPAYVGSWGEFAFLPGVLEPLRLLAQGSRRIIVITNQAAVGRGLVTMETVEEINGRMVAEITAQGGRIDAVYCCPHRPEDGCVCRKPRPGLLLRAARDWGLNLGASYLVGDALGDVQAAMAVGCRPILVRTGRGGEQEPLVRQRWPDVPVVDDLGAAVAWITAADGPVPSAWGPFGGSTGPRPHPGRGGASR